MKTEVIISFENREEYEAWLSEQAARLTKEVKTESKTVKTVAKTAENVEKPQKTAVNSTKPEEPAPAPAPAPDPAPAAAPAVTKEQVTERAIGLMDTGHQAELQALLAKYGVASLPELFEGTSVKMAEFYQDMEGIA
jgi:phage protein D